MKKAYMTRIASAVLTAFVLAPASLSVSAETEGFSELSLLNGSRAAVRKECGTPSSEFSEAQNYYVLSYVGESLADLPSGIVNYCFRQNRLFEIQYLKSFTMEDEKEAVREYKDLVSQVTAEFGKAESHIVTDVSQDYWDDGSTLIFARMSEENGTILIKAEFGGADSLAAAGNYSGSLVVLPSLKAGTAQFSKEGMIYYSETPVDEEADAELSSGDSDDETAADDKTPSGIAVKSKKAVYQTTSNLNLREDASTSSKIVTTVRNGTLLNSTGVCENGWIRVDYNGKTCYVIDDFVKLTDKKP